MMPSLTHHVLPIEMQAYICGAFWLREKAIFVLADGTLRVVEGQDQETVILHENSGILCASCNSEKIVTGSDDGTVMAYDGNLKRLAARPGGWIDAIALNKQGAVAFASGRHVTALDAKGHETSLSVPSSARGLSFAPKGYRLAIAHYNGVSLWYPNLETAPERLDWNGSHLDVTWSFDARFVITSMQENALHGWRLLPDQAHMRMTGYPAKTRSLSWSPDGNWLATSGAEAVILWPFGSHEGPMSKSPRECGARPSKVTRVVFHPRLPILAAGYEDGLVLLIRFDDGAELLVVRESGEAVTAMSFSAKGNHLAFGRADGTGGVLSLP